RSEWRLLGKPDTHRTQSRRHIARIGVGEGPKSGGRRWLLPPVREAHKQDRRHSLLEEGELKFFKVNVRGRSRRPERHHPLAAHGFANHRKGLLPDRLAGHDIIRAIEEAL